jgi:HlyD family secretion protein
MLVPFKKAAPTTAGESSEGVPPVRRSARLARVWALVAAGATAGIAAVWVGNRAGSVHYVAVPVTEGPVAARVTANGTIAARVTVQVGSQVSGRIQQTLVDFNSPVTRGQILARLDPELFRASVAQARANLKAALGNLAKARARAENAAKILERAKTLSARQLIAGADVDSAEADASSGRGDIAAADGGVALARATLRQAEVNLAYATIASPVDGIVISRNVDVGQTVAASLQAPTLFTIAGDLREMQVHTSVPEADVGKLQAGMKATFTVDAFPDERWRGVVREVRNASQVSQNVVTYDAVVDVDNLGARLRPGMTATVSFVVAERSHVLAVPNAALRYQPRPEDPGSRGAVGSKAGDGWRAIYLLIDRAPVRRNVRLGISDGKVTEVAEGEVRPGDLVIIGEKADDVRREGGRRLPSKL